MAMLSEWRPCLSTNDLSEQSSRVVYAVEPGTQMASFDPLDHLAYGVTW